MQEPVPFANNQESGSDALAGGAPFALNVAVDPKGAVGRRPGIELFELSPSTAVAEQAVGLGPSGPTNMFDEPVVGLFSTTQGVVYAVTGEPPGSMKAYRLNTSGEATDLTASGASAFTGSVRPDFAETEQLVLIATGRQIRKVEKETNLQRRLKDSPAASHVVSHNLRLLANDTSTDRPYVNFTAPASGAQSYAGHEQWGFGITALGTSGVFTAESRPDAVIAVAGNANEVRVFGETTTQTYMADPKFIYAPVSSVEYGLSAVNSVVPFDNRFAWLDHQRRIVVSNGRSVEVISDAIQLQLDELDEHTDCFGYRVQTGPYDFLLWTFPADGRTFCYQAGAGWSEWMGWDDGTNNYRRFIVEAHTLVPGSRDNVVGTRRLSGASYVGDIGRMRFGVTTDLGARIPVVSRTGFQNRGTDNRKHCRALHLAFRRGEAATDEPFVRLRYRNDEGPWTELKVSLGLSGDRKNVVTLRSLGVYRRRQWEIAFHGTEDFLLASAIEDFVVLES